MLVVLPLCPLPKVKKDPTYVQCMNIHIAMMGLRVCNMLRGEETTLRFYIRIDIESVKSRHLAC